MEDIFSLADFLKEEFARHFLTGSLFKGRVRWPFFNWLLLLRKSSLEIFSLAASLKEEFAEHFLIGCLFKGGVRWTFSNWLPL